MSVFVLKLIAMVAMVLDHIAYVFLNNNTAVRFIGRSAFIIYAFLIAESYCHLRKRPDRLRAHTLKLIGLSVISDPLFNYVETGGKWLVKSSRNAVVTLALGFIALIVTGFICEKLREKKLLAVLSGAAVWLAAAFTAYYFQSEYKAAGVLLIGMLYLYLKNSDGLSIPQRYLALSAVTVLYLFIYIWSRAKFGDWNGIVTQFKKIMPMYYGAFLPVLYLPLYDRRRGYDSKWFRAFYSLFYPAQFAAIILAMKLTGR